MNELMKEPEVSLRIAIYHIINNLTDENVLISLDGAHIRIKGELQFDVLSFMKENNFEKIDDKERWQGEYVNPKWKQKIIISSKSGIGDVDIILKDRRKLFVESKKGSDKSGNPEYKLMREAVGQLLTNENVDDNTIPAVAVPCYDKTKQLAEKWCKYKRIIQAGIKFILVDGEGKLTVYPDENIEQI